MWTDFANRVGRKSIGIVNAVGYAAALFYESFVYLFVGWKRGQPVRLAPVVEQMRQIGVDAIPIVSLLSFTVGLMLGIQFVAALSDFGAQSQTILAVAKSVTREFGVLITGILVAGRSGSSLAARIGSMTVSQEVDALAVIGVNPVRYLVAPALIAMIIMLPVLTILADVMSILGAAMFVAPTLDMSITSYFNQTLATLLPFDVGQGLIKAVVFAILISLTGVATGFSVQGGAEGVGRATTRSVVISISLIVVADMVFGYFLTRPQ